MSLFCLLGFLILLDVRVNCEFKFTSSDLNLIGKFRDHFDAQHVVFVENGEDVSLVRKIKHLATLTYFTVINSSHFEQIFKSNVSQLNFFQRRATIVTKENLNLTILANSVSSLFLTWVLFKEHTHSQGVYIPADSQVFFVDSTQRAVSINQVYHLKDSGNEIVKALDWNRSPDHFNVNFQGITMNLLFLTPRESCQSLHERALLRKVECIHWTLIELMGEKLNFSLNFIECKEKKFPWTYPNGTDSELFVKLKLREVDFSAVGHVVTIRNRRYYMDFVWPTFVFKSRMYLKQGVLMGRWTSYLKPLESSVWWGIFIWIFVFGILFHALEKLLLNKPKLKIDLILDLAFSLMKSLQVFCNQAMTEVSPFYSVRIVYFLELFVVLVFFQAYCAYLVSSLTVLAPRFPFLDLEGFFANHQYQVMTLQRGFHQFFFRKIIGEGHRENFMLPQEELPETIQQAVDKLCGDPFLTFSEFREDLLEFDTVKCRIAELPTPVVSLFVGIALPKNAPHKEYLRRELLNMKSNGIIERFSTSFSPQWNFLDKRSSDEFKSVSISQTFSVFVLLGFGISLSMVIFAFEMIISSVRRQSVSILRKQK